MATRDKHGREIMVDDLLKIFHFTGIRRQKHYMYKYVISVNTARFTLLHLNAAGDYCTMPNDGKSITTLKSSRAMGLMGRASVIDQKIKPKE